MKKIDLTMIKDIILSILIVLTIILILSVILYDKVSISKIIPESEDYVLSEEMEEDINHGIIDESQEIVTSYYIDAADLKKYEKTKEYDKGKVNPFASESNNHVGNTIDTSGPNGETVIDTPSENKNYYYEDEGIK